MLGSINFSHFHRLFHTCNELTPEIDISLRHFSERFDERENIPLPPQLIISHHFAYNFFMISHPTELDNSRINTSQNPSDPSCVIL